MPEVLLRSEVDQLLIAQIHADAVTLITAEEVAQRGAPWSLLMGDLAETPRRRSELLRWHGQLKSDIELFLDLWAEIEAIPSEDISRVVNSGQRMIATLWKLVE